jgi:hypothetical protein
MGFMNILDFIGSFGTSGFVMIAGYIVAMLASLIAWAV